MWKIVVSGKMDPLRAESLYDVRPAIAPAPPFACADRNRCFAHYPRLVEIWRSGRTMASYQEEHLEQPDNGRLTFRGEQFRYHQLCVSVCVCLQIGTPVTAQPTNFN